MGDGVLFSLANLFIASHITQIFIILALYDLTKKIKIPHDFLHVTIITDVSNVWHLIDPYELKIKVCNCVCVCVWSFNISSANIFMQDQNTAFYCLTFIIITFKFYFILAVIHVPHPIIFINTSSLHTNYISLLQIKFFRFTQKKYEHSTGMYMGITARLVIIKYETYLYIKHTQTHTPNFCGHWVKSENFIYSVSTEINTPRHTNTHLHTHYMHTCLHTHTIYKYIPHTQPGSQGQIFYVHSMSKFQI